MSAKSFVRDKTMTGTSNFFSTSRLTSEDSTDFLPWSEEYNLGIRSVDHDHHILFDVVNNFERSVRKNESIVIVSSTFKALETYVNEHFAREEKHMANAKYPGAIAHRKLHRNLKQDLEGFKRDFLETPEEFDSEEFLGFLGEWLKDHILKEDMAYVSHVKGLE